MNRLEVRPPNKQFKHCTSVAGPRGGSPGSVVNDGAVVGYVHAFGPAISALGTGDEVDPNSNHSDSGSMASDTHSDHWLMRIVTMRLANSRFNTGTMGCRPYAYGWRNGTR